MTGITNKNIVLRDDDEFSFGLAECTRIPGTLKMTKSV